MRYLELVPGVRSSVLGFGCAPILGAVDAGTARLAVAVALDAGITHFDLARSYGYGAAEAWVGREIGGRRDELCLVTKFGIRSTALAWWSRPLKPLVRRLGGRRGSAHGPEGAGGGRPGPAWGDRLHRRVPLTARRMRQSLEESLRALRTDRVEALLLHEPASPGDEFPELIEAAGRLKQEGKIRAWGVAGSYRALSSWPGGVDSFDLVQFSPPGESSQYRAAVRDLAGRPSVLFSPLRRAAGRPGVPVAEALGTFWRDFPRSVILCSMFTPHHIRENARMAAAARPVPS
jgi:hypothetical protein